MKIDLSYTRLNGPSMKIDIVYTRLNGAFMKIDLSYTRLNGPVTDRDPGAGIVILLPAPANLSFWPGIWPGFFSKNSSITMKLLIRKLA